jgi:hypothetical protein
MLATCFECSRPAQHMHHVVPRSYGGTKTIALCEQCHGLIHDKQFMSISALTSSAMQHMKAEGRFTGNDGWQVGADGHLVESEAEQRVLSIVSHYRAQGLSVRKIASILAEKGFRSRAGKPLHFQSVARIAGKPNQSIFCQIQQV